MHNCVGLGGRYAYLRRFLKTKRFFVVRFWAKMCIVALVVDDYLHTCVGLKRRCAYLRWFWMAFFSYLRRFLMKMCILVSVLDDHVHNCGEFAWLCFRNDSTWPARSAGRWPNARCEKWLMVCIGEGLEDGCFSENRVRGAEFSGAEFSV